MWKFDFTNILIRVVFNLYYTTVKLIRNVFQILSDNYRMQSVKLNNRKLFKVKFDIFIIIINKLNSSFLYNSFIELYNCILIVTNIIYTNC